MANAVRYVTASTHGTTANGGCWDLYKVFDSEAVASTATVDSVFGLNCNGIELSQFMTFGFYAVLTGSTPDVTFSFIQSYDDTAANYVAPAVGSSIIQITDTSAHCCTATPTPMPWFRIRAVGGAANGANVTASAWIWMQTS